MVRSEPNRTRRPGIPPFRERPPRAGAPPALPGLRRVRLRGASGASPRREVHRDPHQEPEGDSAHEPDGVRLRDALQGVVPAVAVPEVVNALELMFAHGSTPFRGCGREPRPPRGPWPAFRRSSGRPGGIRTRTSPLLPGAPPGHAYSGSHGAERYNSRSSRTLSETSHPSHGRGKLHGLPPGLSNPRCRMRHFTRRPPCLPPYPTDAPFGIRHLLRTAQSGLEANPTHCL